MELNDQFRDAYFGSSEEREKFSASHQERRRDVEKSEMTHLRYIAICEWERSWTGIIGNTLKEPLMHGMVFQYFTLEADKAITVQTYTLIYLPLLIMIYRCLYRSNQPWPFSSITKCETIPVNAQFRTYQPRSDLLIMKSSLPRLLIEVNSKPQTKYPEDLIRMLLAGASTVRFANAFLDTFKEEKDFVLFAIYVWDNGRVTRFTLFQEQGKSEVCWTLYITKLAG